MSHQCTEFEKAWESVVGWQYAGTRTAGIEERATKHEAEQIWEKAVNWEKRRQHRQRALLARR